ncbi:unnamed protein product [Lampetra fluviatilis]
MPRSATLEVEEEKGGGVAFIFVSSAGALNASSIPAVTGLFTDPVTSTISRCPRPPPVASDSCGETGVDGCAAFQPGLPWCRSSLGRKHEIKTGPVAPRRVL